MWVSVCNRSELFGVQQQRPHTRTEKEGGKDQSNEQTGQGTTDQRGFLQRMR